MAVYEHTEFAEDLLSGNVSLPDPSLLPGEETPFFYMFVKVLMKCSHSRII